MAACAILAGCHNHSHSHGDEEHHHVHEEEEAHGHEGHHDEHDEHEGHDHSGEIVVSLERQKTFGIAVDTVTAGTFCEVLHTSGQILSATGDEMTVVAKTSGTVSLGNLTEGSAVGKGARIATISSKNLGEGDKLAKAKAAYETAKREYERDLQLSKDNIVSESHLDQSKLACEQARAEYEALSSDLTADGCVAVTSPMAGFIKRLDVRQGDYVETGDPVAVVSQNRRLRLRADVSEKYYGMLSAIKDANFSTPYSETTYNLKELGGRLIGYGRASDGDYYIPVTFEFDNRGNLVPGSYADIFLKTSSSKEGISVPVEAVVEDQGVHYVFVQHDETGFFKREVTLGQSDGRRVLVKSGLKEGESVVVSGALQVKLASVTAVPAGHTHNH